MVHKNILTIRNNDSKFSLLVREYKVNCAFYVLEMIGKTRAMAIYL